MANSREEALKIARYLGCSGAHQNKDGIWMPCASHETLQRISTEAETFNPQKKYKSEPIIEDAKTPKRKKKKNWEELGERGVVGIETLAGGGLVSAQVASKALPRIRNINERFDPDAVDGDDDGFVQDSTAWQRPAKPKPSKLSKRTVTGRMARLNEEDQSSLRAYKKILSKLGADDFDSVPEYVESILAGENRESLSNMYPNLAGLPDLDHSDLVRGYILDRNLLDERDYLSDIEDPEDGPFRLIDAFSTDDLLDFDDYMADRFDVNITEDALDRRYPQFAGLSLEELMQLQREYDAMAEEAEDESFLDSLGLDTPPTRRPSSPVQMTLDFDYPTSSSSSSGSKKSGSKWLKKFRAKKKKKKRWNNTPYAGDKQLIDDQKAQVDKFKQYAEQGNWLKFHNEHFDWWTFPIDRGSIAYGERYNLAKTNIKKLRKNKEFTDSVEEAARLYTKALAWDLDKGEWIEEPDFAKGQSPDKFYGTRIWKMARSLQVLGLCDAFNSVQFMIESYRAHTNKYISHLDYWDNPGPCPDDRKLPVQKKSLLDRFDPDAEDGDGDGLVQDSTAFERPARVVGKMSALSRLNDEQKEAFEKAIPVFENPEKRIAEVDITEGPTGSVIMSLPEIPGLADKYGSAREKIKTQVFQPDDDEAESIAEAISEQSQIDINLGEFWLPERSKNGKVLKARDRNGNLVLTINNPPPADRRGSNRLAIGLSFLVGHLTPLLPIYNKKEHDAYVANNQNYDMSSRGMLKNLQIEFADSEAGQFAKEQVDSILSYSDKLDEIAQHYNPIIKAIRERLGLPQDSDRYSILDSGSYLDIALDWMKDPEFKLLSIGSAAPFEHLHDLNHFVLGLSFDRDGEWRNGAAAAELIGFDAARQHINFIYNAQVGANRLFGSGLSLMFENEEAIQYVRTSPEMFRWYK